MFNKAVRKMKKNSEFRNAFENGEVTVTKNFVSLPTRGTPSVPSNREGSGMIILQLDRSSFKCLMNTMRFDPKIFSGIKLNTTVNSEPYSKWVIRKGCGERLKY